MSRKFLLVCCLSLFTPFLFAQQSFEYRHQFILKKDEIGSVYINRKEVTKKATQDNPNKEYLLRFRWTLFTNDLLTVLANYRGHPTQHILKKNYPLESVIFPLLPDGEDIMNSRVYLKMVFVDFNQSNKEAIFDIFIEDTNGRVEVEFKPLKVNQN